MCRLNSAEAENIVNKIEQGFNVRVLFAGISGSHMWGLETPESDIDVRGIYVAPLKQVLALHSGADTIEATWGNVDIQFYEVKKAFNMLNNNNGNLIELILSPTVFWDSKEVDWPKIAKSYIVKKLYRHYKGYYHSQRERASRNRGGKALLYTYREIMQGIWLMRKGELVHNFHELKNRFEREFYKLAYIDPYIARENWNKLVSAEELRMFEAEWEALCGVLEREYRSSSLPETYDGYDFLNKTLVDLRLKVVEEKDNKW
ncbi:MAG: nucleotidyltransferase domain-containing protein [Patescibacteria group bacterium]|jgi:hypothetical protein